MLLASRFDAPHRLSMKRESQKMKSLCRDDFLMRVLTLIVVMFGVCVLSGCGTGEIAKLPNKADESTADSQASDTLPEQLPPNTTDEPDESGMNADRQSTAKSTENSDQGNNEEKSVSGDDEGFESPLDDIPLPAEESAEVHTIDIPESWKRLGKEQEIWLDNDNKQVIAGGVVCLNRGALEMFICPLYTKEHESVIAVNAQSSQIHASLIALGINPGKPVQWEPEYTPVSGPKLKITVLWKDANGQVVKRDSKEMVRDFKTKKELQVDWVFGGSQFYKHEGDEVYLGDGGELVCVSNFATATIDVPIQSSDANVALMYEANTEKIPEIGTKVYVIFEQIVEE